MKKQIKTAKNGMLEGWKIGKMEEYPPFHHSTIPLFLFYLFGIFILLNYEITAIGQNIGINTTGASPAASAGIDVNFPDKGILIPRISLSSTSDVTTISSPATSLMIYNTNTAMTGGGVGYWYWDGATWVRFFTGNSNNLSCATNNYLPRLSSSLLICSQVYDNGTNVGIGTTGPGEKLDVNGSAMLFSGATDGGRLIWRGGSGGTQEYRARVLTDGHLGFFPIETGNPGYIGEVLSLYQNGFVEINNISYPGNLKEYGNIEINHSYDNASPRANHIYLTDQTNANLRGYMGINRNSGAGVDKEYISIEGVEEGVHWMDISLAADGGNVGVGTTDPTDKFQINSGTNTVFMKMDRGTGNPFLIYFGDNMGGSSNANGVVYFEIGGDETYVFGGHINPDADGSRDCGAFSQSWWNVYAYGYPGPSDKRKKENIEPLPYGLNEVMVLKPVTFTWKKFPRHGKQLGFIAQDVQPLLPELIKEGDDEEKSLAMDYTKLTPVLVSAIQEQQKLIEKLEKRVEVLELSLSLQKK